MKQKRTPLAVFAYNRPEHLRLSLGALSRCDRLDECRVFIFCDGPKSAAQKPAVEAVRKTAADWADQMGAELVESQSNLGLSGSIVAGVTTLCERFGRVIVVEDDLILSPSFIDYMLQALDRYENTTHVYQVSGYMFPIEHPTESDAFFLPLSTTWGWATWARAWRAFDWKASGAEAALTDEATRKRFDLDESYPYARMLAQKLAGENDSWGILFWWAVFKAGGLVLHPQRSLVWQGGFDGSGVHCGTGADFEQDSLDAFSQPRPVKSFRWPEGISLDEASFSRVKDFLRQAQYAGTGSTRTKLGGAILKLFKPKTVGRH